MYNKLHNEFNPSACRRDVFRLYITAIFREDCYTKNIYCSVLMTNDMHNSYNQFLFHSFFVRSTCFERI